METTVQVSVYLLADNTLSFTGTGISRDQEHRIEISTRRGRIVFSLQASNVSFPTVPIQWTVQETSTFPGGGTAFRPIDQPAEATVHRTSDRVAEILITNPPAGTRRYSFFVIVQTPDGKFFGTDPTIVTMRPEGGQGGR